MTCLIPNMPHLHTPSSDIFTLSTNLLFCHIQCFYSEILVEIVLKTLPSTFTFVVIDVTIAKQLPTAICCHPCNHREVANRQTNKVFFAITFLPDSSCVYIFYSLGKFLLTVCSSHRLQKLAEI